MLASGGRESGTDSVWYHVRLPAPSAFTSRGWLDGDEAMLRTVLIVVAGLVVLRVALAVVEYLMGRRDRDIRITVDEKTITLFHAGETLSNVVLMINGRHRIELGDVPVGVSQYSDEQVSPPVETIDLAARRGSRTVKMHQVFERADP